MNERTNERKVLTCRILFLRSASNKSAFAIFVVVVVVVASAVTALVVLVVSLFLMDH
jgi:hypothetical protein